jgi:purine-nucleoside phosphorylase
MNGGNPVNSGNPAVAAAATPPVARAVQELRRRIPAAPQVAVVLGSGLGAFADRLDDALAVDYADIPDFPRPTVVGHKGRLVFGTSGGRPVVAMQGRMHLYEGIDAGAVVFGVRTLAALGVPTLVLTTASGGIHRHYAAGDIMLIEDQVNLQMRRLGGLAAPAAPAWRAPGPIYSPGLLRKALAVAHATGEHRTHRGVFGGMLGPNYETPAEVRMLRALGADAVSMSTVLEAVAARDAGMQVLGISAIVNPAAGISPTPLNHEEVLEMAKEMEARLLGFLAALIPAL